jgi:hypothetical protein
MESRPKRRIGRLVLWAGLGLALLSCGVCSGVTFYATTVEGAPLIISAGDIHAFVIRSPQFDPDSVYKVLSAPPIEVGLSSQPCVVAFFDMNEGLQIGDYSIRPFSCGKQSR